MATVHFTLRTLIADTTFYITYGSMNCIKSKEVPESFTENNPGSGKAKANFDGSCWNKSSKIHLYLWADSEHSESLANIKLREESQTAAWTQDVLSVADGYDLLVTTGGVNDFSFTLLLSDDA